MRLIDAEALKKHYAWWEDDRQILFDSIVDSQPTVDAVPVVRCEQCTWQYMGECMFWAGDGMLIEHYDYCSRGKRK